MSQSLITSPTTKTSTIPPYATRLQLIPTRSYDGPSRSRHVSRTADSSHSGKEIEYQNLAREARLEWLRWNDEVAASNDLPKGIRRDRPLFRACGLIKIATGEKLDQIDLDSIAELEKVGLREPQHVLVSWHPIVNGV